MGVVTGYSHSRVDFNDVYFDGDVDSFDLGLYGSYTPGAWYLDASFTWARNWHDTERYDLFAAATAEAQYHGDLFATVPWRWVQHRPRQGAHYPGSFR